MVFDDGVLSMAQNEVLIKNKVSSSKGADDVVSVVVIGAGDGDGWW